MLHRHLLVISPLQYELATKFQDNMCIVCVTHSVISLIWLEAETVVHVDNFIHTEHVALKHNFWHIN